MRRRWNANTWVLTILGTILLLVGIDVGRRLVAGPASGPEPPKASIEPDFKVGDTAPDFTLPDNKKREQTLSKLVKRDTLLTFSCGCNQCKEFQTWTGKLLPLMGKDAPEVISVNTTSPEAAETWVRDTRLKQTFLYGPHDQGPVAAYHGKPCPRTFRLDADRKVRWIGSSRSDGRLVRQLGMELGEKLNMQKYARKAPAMNWESDGAANPSGLPQPGAAPPPGPPAPGGLAPGHSADDGHGH